MKMILENIICTEVYVKKMAVAFAFVLMALVLSSCGNIGVDAPPKVGPNLDEHGHPINGDVTLYVSGAIFNNDFSKPWDGIAWEPWNNALGGQMNMASSPPFFRAWEDGEKKSTRAWEFMMHRPGNYGQGALVTLLDPLPANFSKLTFWAMVAAGGAGYDQGKINFDVLVERQDISGAHVSIVASRDTTIPLDGQWRLVEVNFRRTQNTITVQTPDGERIIPDPSDIAWIMPGDRILQWRIDVPQDAGRIFVDEVKLVN